MPSAGEASRGGTIHGEAGVLKWIARPTKGRSHAKLDFSVWLPQSALAFSRSLLLNSGESVVYVRELVKNLRPVRRKFQWQQHATIGAPFLQGATIVLPGARGKTLPSGYEGRELLKSNAEFDWPYAPRFNGGRVDLRRSLTTPGRGFVAGVQIAPHRTHGFVCALNARGSLAVGYCFRRQDYPWVALWEENVTRKSLPWRACEQTRGLEFGCSPLPLTRSENHKLGQLFGTPTLAHVSGGGTRTIGYAMFVAKLPAGTKIKDVHVCARSIDLIGSSGNIAASLPATSIHEYLA